MESVTNFLSEHLVVLSISIVIVIATMAYIASSRFNLWVRDFWATFPVVGTIARLSRDNTQAADGWFRAEETLCAVYAPFSAVVGPEEFRESTQYLRKATDLGRRSTPFGVWALLVLLVVAEGLGFSYLLGTWMAREGSANTHTLLMVAIVFVLCAILVAVTHKAGSQYRRTSLLRSCFKRYKDLGAKEYAADLVELDTDQSIDDHEPGFKQTVNRVAAHSHDKGTYMAMTIAIISIAVIAVLSTVMRYQNMQSSYAIDAMLQKTEISAPAGDPFASGNISTPAAVSEPDQEARRNGEKNAKDAVIIEGLSAFLMLAFIFIVTQIVGIGAGYKYSFAGSQSEGAFKVTKGFATYAEYFRSVKPLNDLANGRLKQLQQKLEEKSNHRLALTHTFDDYIIRANKSAVSLVKNADQGWREKRDANKRNQQGYASASAFMPTTAPVAAHVGETDAAPLISDPKLTSDTAAISVAAPTTAIVPATGSQEIAAIIANMELIDDADAEKAYYQTLPATTKINPDLLAWMQARKSQRTNLA